MRNTLRKKHYTPEVYLNIINQINIIIKMAENTVKMKPVDTSTAQERPEKMSYEQLENIARQLSAQNEQLVMQLNSMRNTYILNIMEFLMRIAEHPDNYPSELVDYCRTEVSNKIYEFTKKESKNDTDTNNPN